MGSSRCIGVASSHITTTNSALKFLRFSYRTAIWIVIFGLVGSIATSAQALPRPAKQATLLWDARTGRRAARRIAWKKNRAASRLALNPADRSRSKAMELKIWKDASIACHHFYPTLPSSGCQPTKVASFVCRLGKSECYNALATSLNIALFAFTVIAGGVAGVALWAAARLVAVELLPLWHTISVYAQAIIPRLSPMMLQFNQSPSQLLQYFVMHYQTPHSLLLCVHGVRMWLFSPLNSFMFGSTRLLVQRLVRMWLLLSLNGREIKSASAAVACLGLLLTILTWIGRGVLSRMRAHRTLDHRASKSSQASAESGPPNADTPQCTRCFRARPDFDTWFHRYLAARGLKLASRAPLDLEDARSIWSLIHLHGSDIMRVYLPIICERGSRKDPSGVAHGSPAISMGGRPVEVDSECQLGPLYSDAKAELVLHCQCADRIASECGGHLYSAFWAHPSGEELSGGDAGSSSPNWE